MSEITDTSKAVSRYHHGSLRSSLIDHGRKLVESSGVEGLSLRAVAKLAGVSPAAPYHHFPDKAALLAAVAAHSVAELNEALAAADDRAEMPLERLHELGVAYVLHAARNPELFVLSQGPMFPDLQAPAELRERRAETFAMLRDAVGECLPQCTEQQMRDAFASAWSFVHGLASLAIDGRLGAVVSADDLEATARRLVRHLSLNPSMDD